jgi:N-acyl-D-amino-acid deacylase
MADFDLQIKGGTVVDGTRAPRYRADVWVKDGKIAQVGGRAPGFAKKVIDADGLIVAPGFVDLHTITMRRFAGIRTARSPDGTA